MGARHAPVRRRWAVLLPVLVLALATPAAGGAVVWLAAHLLPHAGADEAPTADVVELVKAGPSVGLSRLAAG